HRLDRADGAVRCRAGDRDDRGRHDLGAAAGDREREVARLLPRHLLPALRDPRGDRHDPVVVPVHPGAEPGRGSAAAGLHQHRLPEPDMVLWSIAHIVTWTYTGYNMLIIIAQLKSIPGELYEAAKIDGASTFRVATSNQLPLLRPA